MEKKDKKAAHQEFFDWLAMRPNAIRNFEEFIEDIDLEKGISEPIKRVYKVIDEIIFDSEKKKFKKTVDADECLYRARIIDPKDDKGEEKGICITSNGKFKGYNEAESREPVLGRSGEGRINMSGASYLYVASDKETACMEVKSQFAELISLATFKVKKPLHIIDFADDKSIKNNGHYLKDYNMDISEFITRMMMQFSAPVRNEKAYRVTQIIADHIRKTGIDGIRYRSFLCPGGFNYVFFNCHPKYIKFCESRVIIHRQAKESFWDFNDETEIISNPEEKYMRYDEKKADELKRQLQKRFKREKNG